MSENLEPAPRGWAVARASLALIKYWGKDSVAANTPATGSLAVTLSGLESKTSVSRAESDSVVVGGQPQPLERYVGVLEPLKAELGLTGQGLAIVSENNFPTAAGLASSSSGFAALVAAVAAFSGRSFTPEQLSRWARLGSGSATRSIYGGFTEFPARAEYAVAVHDESFWPEFRVVLAVVRESSKAVSSRSGMESSRATSPYYGPWVESSAVLLEEARQALAERNLPKLGPLIRQSYLRMFATMFTADPPLIYWQPDSLALIQTLETLRAQGIGVWETMDAGPQVKMFCLERDVDTIVERLSSAFGHLRFLTARVGSGIEWGTA